MTDSNQPKTEVIVVNPAPSQQQKDDPGRDAAGRFLPGHTPTGASPWQPGQSGNPGGATRGQAQPGRWLGSLCDLPEDELKAIVQDGSASASKRAAAQLILDALDDDPSTRRRALSMICDRTEGKPGVNVTLQNDSSPRSLDELMSGFTSLVVQYPALAQHMRRALDKCLE
jgi:hypothetical protein